MPSDKVLEIDGIEQHLRDAARGEEFVVRVSQRITLHRGAIAALLGPSGCGKTTLLTVFGLLRAPTHPQAIGRFAIWTRDAAGGLVENDLKDLWLGRRQADIDRIRRRHVGFALQSGELLPALTVRENIAAPLSLNGVSGPACRQRVDELLDAFGLHKTTTGTATVPQATRFRLDSSRINKLSGGEYQRVALARAMAHRPTLIFVDEPTASLNRELAWGALDQLRRLLAADESHHAVIMITHDERLADEFATLIIRMAPVKGRAEGEVVEVLDKNGAGVAT